MKDWDGSVLEISQAKLVRDSALPKKHACHGTQQRLQSAAGHAESHEKFRGQDHEVQYVAARALTNFAE